MMIVFEPQIRFQLMGDHYAIVRGSSFLLLLFCAIAAAHLLIR
jgi:hypothetical protein